MNWSASCSLLSDRWGSRVRVRNLGMDATVRGLVDKAIMQRAAQVANGL